jgi:hypothetical protein
MIYIIDIETNGLLSDMLDYSSFPYKLRSDAKLWCVVIRNYKNDKVVTLVKDEITKERLAFELKDATYIVAHNGIKFDFLTLKLFGVFDYEVGYIDKPDLLFQNKVTFIDTLILSRLFNPSRYGGHSLDAWGERLKEPKSDFRQLCIDKGYIDSKSPKGEEFKNFVPEMVDYCIQDTKVNAILLTELSVVKKEWDWWDNAIKKENKLADLGVKREHLGFAFDKEKAVELVKDLTSKMKVLEDRVNPILPPKKLNATEQSFYTPPKNQLSYSKVKETTPPKNQLKKDGSISSSMENFMLKNNVVFKDGFLFFEGRNYDFPLLTPLVNEPTPSETMYNFAEKVGGEIKNNKFMFQGVEYKLPMECKPIIKELKSSINDLDHVKKHLINLGWNPSEWKVRDLTKDAKKQSISYDKRIKALERWLDETFEKGKYKTHRLKELGMHDRDSIFHTLSEKLKDDFPVRVPTSPSVRVGLEKELCPHLESLGDKVSFAKDFTLYLTYKHRKTSLAGGDIEDMDFDEEAPNTGLLSIYREDDGRVPTAAIEIGAQSNRFRHIGVVNVPRVSSTYGYEMRSLFGCGEDAIFFGWDMSSLENRIMAHYVMKYPKGKELANEFIGDKPNDFHSLQAKRLGLDRNTCKSVNYGILYGSQVSKIMNMLSVSKQRATEVFNGFWDNAVALKSLKDILELYWEKTGQKYIKAIDGRKIITRSKHSLLNALFQSGGVILTKYTEVYLGQYLEEANLCIDCFEGKPDVATMISMHDELAMYCNPKLFKFKTFETEDEAKDFISKWEGEQLSAIGHGKKYFVCLPSVVSRSIQKAIDTTESRLKMNVNFGYEYMLGSNWAQCH